MPSSTSSKDQEHSTTEETIDLVEHWPALGRYYPHRPTDKQAAFLIAPCLELFYGGAAGGGKSDTLLAGALQYVDVPGYAAILFRRTYTDLALPGAIMARAHEWLAPTDAFWSQERKTWTFPSGATVTFGYLDSDNDVYRYQSAEFQYVGFDELTQFTEAQYRYLFSRLRKPADGSLGRLPLRMRSASNPGGVGHNWVKRKFITDKERGVAFIPARLDDNPYVDEVSYRTSLAKLSPILQEQLLAGDWGAFEGAAYPEFRPETHVVKPFAIPDSWERFECMDHGSTNPTAWYACASDFDGNIVVFDEYYSPGLVSEHALQIIERRAKMWTALNTQGSPVHHTTWADPSVRSKLPTRTQMGVTSVDAEYGQYGIVLTAANNDRRAGFLRLAELVKLDPMRRVPSWAPSTGPQPQLYVFATCTNLIEQLQTAPIEDTGPLTGEAVDADWESQHGHGHAAIRYGMLSRPSRSNPRPVIPETPIEVRDATHFEYEQKVLKEIAEQGEYEPAYAGWE